MVQVVEGAIGRILVIRIEHGDDLIPTLTHIAETRGIRHGLVQLLGAVGSGMIVSGPHEPVLPPIPHEGSFEGGWDLLGIGTIHPHGTGVKLHLHATGGRHHHVVSGCLRAADVYIIIEAIIFEITGIEGEITHDEQTGIALPLFRMRGDG